jgi:N-acylneuraminate cytidylyltransferase
MKIIIPAKRASTRVPDKNWRLFCNGKNLVEIKIEQLLKAADARDLFLSCDDPSKKAIADAYGINFLLRDPLLASDLTPWPDALQGIIAATDFDGEEEIAWVEVINPLFDDYAGMFAKWQEVKHQHDSLVLAAPINKFLLRADGKPVNFQFGKWHSMSQQMESLYAWDSACIMRKKDLLYFSYPIGKTPYMYSTGNQCVDIDTMDDFETAHYYYTKKHKL